MKPILIDCFLQLNKLFPKKHHPFHDLKNGIHDLNYTDFEYAHTEQLLKMYKDFYDFSELKWKKILEIWCGWWGKVIYISEHFDCSAVWIDLNLNFLSQAKSKAQEKWVESKVSFLEMNALELKFDDDEFDMVFMSDVLEHIPNTDKLIKEVCRVTKKDWSILFDFAPYYHYFGHHLWDTIQIPWLHLITTEKFRIDLYKQSVKGFPDADKRIDLRIWKNNNGQESFTYLNGITRKKFENIISKCEEMWIFKKCTISYFMLKNILILNKIPFLREIGIRHIVWVLKK